MKSREAIKKKKKKKKHEIWELKPIVFWRGGFSRVFLRMRRENKIWCRPSVYIEWEKGVTVGVGVTVIKEKERKGLLCGFMAIGN